jgi:hypothetical protein
MSSKISSDVFPVKLLSINETYVSIESSYRSYGTNDHTGNGFGVEVSKDVNKWLGVGLNVSYWQNNKKDWDFTDPFTKQNYKYFGNIKDFKISPFIQLVPINTKYFDFYAQLGLTTGIYNQKYYGGGYSTSYNPQIFDVFISDIGEKGFSFGYNVGLGMRFQFGKIIIVPNSVFVNDTNGNGFNSLNLKVGYQF